MPASYVHSQISGLRYLLRKLCQLGFVATFVFGLSLSAFASTATNYTFTDQQGRTLVAHIISVSEPNVYLQLEKGQPFPVKIGVFIPKDQTYIRQWALDNAKSVEPFAVFALKNVLTDASSNLPMQGFDLTRKNLSGKSASNLHVEYIVFRQPDQASSGPLPRITGANTISSIPNGQQVSFSTDRISAKGNRLAVWVRVYASNGTLLQQWSSDPEMTQNEVWGASEGRRSGKTVSENQSAVAKSR